MDGIEKGGDILTMKREIKFRYYDRSIKAMIQPSAVGIYGYYEEDRDFEDGISQSLDNLMQYTGMKDRNGIEIYKGDIVSLIEPNRLYTVEWIEYTFKLVHADAKLERMHWGSIQRVSELMWSIEVTGNIFSNPELLTL